MTPLAEIDYVQLALLRVVLQQARAGTLETDWRDKVPVAIAESGALSDGRDGDVYAAAVCAGRELVDIRPEDWEPDSGVGWRKSLDSWFEATKGCLMVFESAEQHLRAGFPSAGIVSQAAMDRDLATASYRAGLAAGGLDVPDWYGWLNDRVYSWPDKMRRDDQIDLMTLEPGYRESIEQLPAYWAGC